MVNPVHKAAMDWEAGAIEKARNDPRTAELGLCPVCMCSSPCICEKNRIADKMLAHWKAHPKGNIESAKSVSWGAGKLMLDLYKIATGTWRGD